MYVLPKNRLIFLAQPRTASRSIAQAIQGYGGIRRGGHHHVAHKEIARATSHGWTVASTVRHHLDTVVSWWTMAPQTQTLGEYWRSVIRDASPENTYYRPHALYWQCRPFSTFVLRYESLQKSWDALCEQIGLERNILPHLEDSRSWRRKVPWRGCYTDELEAEVRTYYWAEMRELGY